MSGNDCTSACTASSMDGSSGSPRTDSLGLGGGWQQPCRYGQFMIALEVFSKSPMVASVLLAAHADLLVRIAANHRAEQTGQCC